MTDAMQDVDYDPVCWSWPLPEDRTGSSWAVLGRWQGDRCAICGMVEYDRVLDHDHQTGWSRGRICHTCNVNEGTCASPQSVYARWRACPATAVLDLLIPYMFPRGTNIHGDIEIWTGRTYLPDWAPNPNRWPHAVTCAAPPVPITKPPGLEYQCDHSHIDRIAASWECPSSNGVELIVAVPEEGRTRLALARRASRAVARATRVET